MTDRRNQLFTTNHCVLENYVNPTVGNRACNLLIGRSLKTS